jgi:hypothetical protein
MTDIFLDASLASVPGAASHVAHLVDAGHDIAFVGASAGVAAAHPGVPVLDRLPAEPVRGSWFVTSEPARCADRPAGVRTLLIGPRVDRSTLQKPRCNSEARDLGAAVLEILTHDAMGT